MDTKELEKVLSLVQENLESKHIKQTTNFFVTFIASGTIFFLAICILFSIMFHNQSMVISNLETIIVNQNDNMSNMRKVQIATNKAQNLLIVSQSNINKKLEKISSAAEIAAKKAQAAASEAEASTKLLNKI